jgi:hypothetical protein
MKGLSKGLKKEEEGGLGPKPLTGCEVWLVQPTRQRGTI